MLTLKCVTAILMITASATTYAEDSSQSFPAAVTAYLDNEIPKMDAAVEAKDRSYFSGATQRTQALLNDWRAFDPGNTLLDRYPACADALTDYAIVGLCKNSPPGTLCEPSTFFRKFDRNRATCRQLAGQADKQGAPGK